jgi:general secretion pathway protein A
MYLQYYQLARKPFDISTDPDFLWFGEKHREALATLKYGVMESKGFLLLTGDVGVGKTTITNALLSGLGENDLAVAVHDPAMEQIDFFNYIARCFGLSGTFETKGAFLVEFIAFLNRCYYQGRRVVLIIDECQLISHELLNDIRLFSNLEKKGRKLINIFLVGQLELNDLLLKPENRAIRQRITVNFNIEPLTVNETEKYVQHRLKVAGSRRSIFDKGAMAEIYSFSGGYPRLINVIADRALLTGFIAKTSVVNSKIVRECAQELKIRKSVSPTVLGQENTFQAGKKISYNKRGLKFGYFAYPLILILLTGVLYLYFTDPQGRGLDLLVEQSRLFVDFIANRVSAFMD